jgi:hypothetical protein
MALLWLSYTCLLPFFFFLQPDTTNPLHVFLLRDDSGLRTVFALLGFDWLIAFDEDFEFGYIAGNMSLQ